MRRLVTLLAAPLLAIPVTARAESPVLVYADVWLNRWIGSTAEVCAEGWLDDGAWIYGEFTLTFTGTVPTPPQQTYAAPGFPYDCLLVSIAGQSAGYFEANLSYGGAGVPDLSGTAGIVVVWSPLTGANETGYGTNRSRTHVAP